MSCGAEQGIAAGLVAEFLGAYPRLAQPAGATSQCRIATTVLVDRLSAVGQPASAVWVRRHRIVPLGTGVRALEADRHLIVRLGRSFIDVTRRQFDATATHPRWYSSESDLAEHWCEIDDGPVDGRLEDEMWRALPGSSPLEA